MLDAREEFWHPSFDRSHSFTMCSLAVASLNDAHLDKLQRCPQVKSAGGLSPTSDVDIYIYMGLR